MPQFDAGTFPSQIVWLIVSLVALHLLLTKIGLPRITNIYAAREQAIAGNVTRTQEAVLQTEELQRERTAYEGETAAMVQSILEERKKEVNAAIQKMEAKAQDRIAAKVQEGQARIETMGQSVREDLDTIVRSLVADISGQILASPPSPQHTDRAIRQALAEAEQ